jgi:hypothetical protein
MAAVLSVMLSAALKRANAALKNHASPPPDSRLSARSPRYLVVVGATVRALHRTPSRCNFFLLLIRILYIEALIPARRP